MYLQDETAACCTATSPCANVLILVECSTSTQLASNISPSISKAVCSWTCFLLCSLKQWSPLSISDSTLIQGCNFGTVQPVIWSHSPQWLDQPATFAEICFQRLPHISPILFKSFFLKVQNIWFVYFFSALIAGFLLLPYCAIIPG